MESQNGAYTALIPSRVSPNAPVVVIMGWVGASDKVLGKYSQLLASWGYPSVRCVCPTAYILLGDTALIRTFARGLLDFAFDQGLLPSRPLVLYSFSNGGAYVMSTIQTLCDQDSRYSGIWPRVLACIFDSSPAFAVPGMRRRVYETITPPGLTRLVGNLRIAWHEFKESFARNSFDDRFRTQMLRLGSEQPHLPLLYLYSQADELTDPVKLGELIDQKKALGHDVTAKCWKDSRHVMHFLKHPQEYTLELARFLSRAAPVIQMGRL